MFTLLTSKQNIYAGLNSNPIYIYAYAYIDINPIWWNKPTNNLKSDLSGLESIDF